MKYTTIHLFLAMNTALLAMGTAESAVAAPAAKPRVIATTDGEVDDRCTMARFLMYANEWDIQGIIHSSSKFHWAGDETHEANDWKPVEWLDRQIDAYEKVYPNLKKHDAKYATPNYLRSQVFVGNIAYEGAMEKPTPGSGHIVEVLLNPDESPIWLQAWGGSNTIARALKTIKDEHPERVEEVSQKARLFLIAEQDKTLRDYIRPEWPEVQILLSDWPSFEAIAYPWKKILSEELQRYFDQDWMKANMLEGHGPLGAMYEAGKDGAFRSEGDTPSFLHVINTGLRSDAHPAFGGWGGRFALTDGVWRSVDERGAPTHSILRWAADFQNDWAARADWCVKSFEEANHPPKVLLSHASELKARPGERVRLDAAKSSDPDGDPLAFNWWCYAEAGTYGKTVDIENPNRADATLAVPADASSEDTIHAICSMTDSGEPPLTRYARVLIAIHE